MPESWNLASQMSIVIQLANIGPLVVTLMDLKCNRYLKLEPLVSLEGGGAQNLTAKQSGITVVSYHW